MKKIIFILFLIIGIVVVGYIYLKFTKNPEISSHETTPSPTNSAQKLKTFQSSSAMNFTIQVPNNHQVSEEFGTVTITSPNGEIKIAQNGTNFDNLNDHIEALEKLNKISFIKTEDLTINTFQAQKGMINEEQVYFIYVRDNVYTISTKNTILFIILDQIAQSFKYTP